MVIAWGGARTGSVDAFALPDSLAACTPPIAGTKGISEGIFVPVSGAKLIRESPLWVRYRRMKFATPEDKRAEGMVLREAARAAPDPVPATGCTAGELGSGKDDFS